MRAAATLSSRMIAIALLAFVFLGASDSTARFNDLGHRMMCVCGCGQILLECNHVGCNYSERMRNELQAGLDRGDNDDLVLQSFVQKYGSVVLAAPTEKGFNRVAWVMPYLALFGGCGLAALLIRKWHLRAATVPAAATPGVDLAFDAYREQARKETEL